MKTIKTTTAIGPFTSRDKKVHTQFAILAAREEGWESTSAQFKAMKCECAHQGLRACDFRHFTKCIRAIRGHHLFWTTCRTSIDMSQNIIERTPRAASVASLLRALDRVSILGW